MSKLRLLDLFSGIGGFSLGLERTGGFETVAFCEIEDFPRRVLKKHWPKVPCYHDIRDLTADTLRTDGIEVDAICGGFPCQPFSVAGQRGGFEDDRSLWPEMARVIGETRPQVVFAENVAGIISMELDSVLSDLEGLGYTCWSFVIPACAIDAKHRRDRLWIIAHTDLDSVWQQPGRINGARGAGEALPSINGEAQPVADGNGDGRDQEGKGCTKAGRNGAERNARWPAEPELGRVAHGVPDRAHRLKALGNAVVPQIPEMLGNAYLQSIGWSNAA